MSHTTRTDWYRTAAEASNTTLCNLRLLRVLFIIRSSFSDVLSVRGNLQERLFMHSMSLLSRASFQWFRNCKDTSHVIPVERSNRLIWWVDIGGKTLPNLIMSHLGGTYSKAKFFPKIQNLHLLVKTSSHRSSRHSTFGRVASTRSPTYLRTLNSNMS